MTEQAVAEATKKINQTVTEAGGLVKVTLGTLREEMGYGRLGKHVLTNLEQHLTENGLGYFPLEMLDPILNESPRQWQEIYVFVDDESPKANVFKAVADPENYSLVEALDELIASAPPTDKPNYGKMSAKARLALIEELAHVA